MDEENKQKATIEEIVETLDHLDTNQRKTLSEVLGQHFTGDDPVKQIANATPMDVQRVVGRTLTYFSVVQLIRHARNEYKPYHPWPPLET